MIKSPSDKIHKDKLRLKQLLDDFGLELPEELKTIDEPIVETTKSP